MKRKKTNVNLIAIVLSLIAILTTQAKAATTFYEVWRNTESNLATAEPILQWYPDDTNGTIEHFDPKVDPNTDYYYWVRSFKGSLVTDYFQQGDSHGTLILWYAMEAKNGTITDGTPGWPSLCSLDLKLCEDSGDYEAIFDTYVWESDGLIVPSEDVQLHEDHNNIWVTQQCYSREDEDVIKYYHEPIDLFSKAEIGGESDPNAEVFAKSEWDWGRSSESETLQTSVVDVKFVTLAPGPNDFSARGQNDPNGIKLTWTGIPLQTTEFSQIGPVRLPRVIYVNMIRASGNHDGTDWANAYQYLQDALTDARYNDEIWVAWWIDYRPDSNKLVQNTDDPNAAFFIPNGVALYGGFRGYELSKESRNWEDNETVLNGDIGIKDDVSDNSFHVVRTFDCGSNTILDGFTVTSGNAHGTEINEYGGGMHNVLSTVTVRNCKFVDNIADLNGGAILNSFSSPYIEDCHFIENIAVANGGAMANYQSNPIIRECAFTTNVALQSGGSIINWLNSDPIIAECAFVENYASNYGGALCNTSNCDTSIINCVFVKNSADLDGGAVFNTDCKPVLTNSVFNTNQTGGNGGGMCNENNSDSQISSCTFSGNNADGCGGGIYNSEPPNFSLAEIRNSIFWGNSDSNGTDEFSQIGGYLPFTNTCCIQDASPGDGYLPFGVNSDENPLFVKDPDPGVDGIWGTLDDRFGDLRLEYDSPCIETANHDYMPVDTLDLDGDSDTAEPVPYDADRRSRFIDADNDFFALADIGAYEKAVCPGNPDLNRDGLVNFTDYAMFAARWLDTGCDCYGACCDERDFSSDGSVDIDDFSILIGNWVSGFKLFSDDFSYTGEPVTWTTLVNGTWSIENFRLKGVGAGGGRDAWLYTGDKLWTDYSISADVEMTSGNCEFVLRSTGHWENEYRITIWRYDHSEYPNQYCIAKYQDGTYIELASSSADGITSITRNSHVKVSIIKNDISLYINDVFIDSVTDPNPLTNGRIGLGVIWSYTGYFDNVVVTQLEDPNKVYNLSNGHYYERIEEGLTWEEAREAAESKFYKGMRGHLATVTSESENDFIKNKVVANNCYYWLGGFQLPETPSIYEPDLQWRWVTGEEWQWANWYSGEPNDDQNKEDLLAIMGDVHHGHWNDCQETTVAHYIVEYERY